jgi:transcriptional/translational regulatory protein YebC/TACO1
VRNILHEQGLVIKSAELTYEPVVTMPILDKELSEKALQFLDKLESLDDVQKVYANFDIPDSIMQLLR